MVPETNRFGDPAMSERFASAGSHSGAEAMTRLTERLAALAPSAAPMELARTQAVSMPRTSPAAAAAMSAAIAARGAERARRSRSVIGLMVDGFVAVCAIIPYALVALVLRLAIARAFFVDGQGRVSGPVIPFDWQGFHTSLVLPLQLRVEAVTSVFMPDVALPVSPLVVAYLVAGAEFILPICLVLGFATRFAAFGLLVVTVLLQLFVVPQALWTTHIYWASVLLVLISLGPGRLSLDALIRLVARR
jgi:putative oxidoreductase